MTQLSLAARAVRLLPAETAHGLTVSALSALDPLLRSAADDPALAVRLPRSGLALANPVGLAAGFDKNAEAFAPMLKLGFGFVECGTVTPRPQAGNDRPRLFRLAPDEAVINRMGFNNAGLAAFVERLARRPAGAPVGANVGANKDSEDRIGDYVAGVEAVWPHAAWVTVNISSPNTPGLRGLQDPAALEELLGRVGEAAAALTTAHGLRPLFLKLSPDLDAAGIAGVIDRIRAAPLLHGLILTNTTLDRPAGLSSRRRSEAGGLSGRPVFARSTAVLQAFADEVGDRFDLIGAGGVSCGRDAYAKIEAGAHAVQLYTALVYSGPSLVARIKRDLAAIVRAEGFRDLSEAIAARR
jgi:dihydroorotate dehydrogenase